MIRRIKELRRLLQVQVEALPEVLLLLLLLSPPSEIHYHLLRPIQRTGTKMCPPPVLETRESGHVVMRKGEGDRRGFSLCRFHARMDLTTCRWFSSCERACVHHPESWYDHSLSPQHSQSGRVFLFRLIVLPATLLQISI